MDIGIFRSIAEKARKISWAKTAQLDQRQVEVLDVDLNAKASLNAPLSALVAFRDAGNTRYVKGVFWPKDMRPESVVLDDKEQTDGKVSIAGKVKLGLPPKAIVRLRFRWKDSAGGAHEFLVEGKAGLGLLGDLF
jgi:hypothetical protein